MNLKETGDRYDWKNEYKILIIISLFTLHNFFLIRRIMMQLYAEET